ncbi:hypothetical protein BMS3Bbin02_00357 [bacterium BMS3Bbin02]|nr:hypothetical protein BMS3Bbin02_00357 [bacterium BMS3Bbin02]
MRSIRHFSSLIAIALITATCSSGSTTATSPGSLTPLSTPVAPATTTQPAIDDDAALPGIAFLDVNDFSEFRVHEPGSPFTVNVTLDLAGPVFVRWVDPTGAALSPQLIIRPGASHDLTVPSTQPGWYGLEFTAPAGVILADRVAGEPLIYGFAIAPDIVDQSFPDTGAAFGLVQPDMLDPVTPTWIKTMTTETTGPQWFSQELNHRRALGHEELPIVMGGAWESRNDLPLSDTQRSDLRAELTALFTQQDAAVAWELGLEENLNDGWGSDQYWDNLAVKSRIARDVADAAPNDVRLIYQLATLNPTEIARFLDSPAARYFDVLSLHPYAWPDFPPPASWLSALVADIQQQIAHSGRKLDIWFTEIGVPINAAPQGEFFGYPESGERVAGLDPAGAADFLAQTYALALASGVDKVFWYNYRDAGPERNLAESNFGLVDFRGYPKPAYAAYATSATMLEPAQPVSMEDLDGMSVATFETDSSIIRAIWSDKPTTIDLTQFGDVRRIVSQYGADQLTATILDVTPSVVYVVSSR